MIFNDVFDQRMMWITKSIVQNPPIFTIDFKDFAIATKYENRWKYLKNYVNVHVSTTP